MSITENKNFIAYSLPGHQNYVYHIINSISKNQDVAASNDFVVAPFDNDIHDVHYLSLDAGSMNSEINCTDLPMSDLKTTQFDEYKSAFAACKKLIDNGSVKKIVLSKIKCIQADHTYPEEIFKLLVSRYTDAFVYILKINDQCWLGATPELLLSRDSLGYHTVALAGTQPVGNLKEIVWSDKEKGEHALIEEHLKTVFNASNTEYDVGNAYNQQAGAMVHIKSDIHFRTDLELSKILDFVHPGPAISGFDAASAKKYLRDIEKHDRRLYAGYLGLLKNKDIKLFVNLRCMQVFKNQYCLYLGGGLLADSDIEKEWQETELKASTMESIIEMVKQ